MCLAVVAVALAAAPAAAQPPVKGAVLPESRGAVPPRAAVPPAPTPAGPRGLDRHGDPLPAGAVARFGSVRLRHGGGLAALTFSPDGKHLVTVSATEPGLRLWEPATGKEVTRLTQPFQTAVVAPDRTVLFAADGRLRVWEPFAGGRVRELPPNTLPDPNVSALAVLPDGKRAAAATPAGVTVFDLTTGDQKAHLKVPGDQPAIRLVASADGRWLAATAPQSGVWLWDMATGRRVRSYAPVGETHDFAFSPDGSRLVVAGAQLALFHTDSEEKVEGFREPEEATHAARFAADGKSLLALRADGSLTRLDAATGEAKETWAAPAGANPQTPVAVAADGAWVAAMDESGGIRVWRPRDGTGPAVDRLPPLIDPGFLPSGAASAVTFEGKVLTFDPATGAAGTAIDAGLDREGGWVWDARTGLLAGLGKEGDDAELHVVEAATKKVLAKLPVRTEDGWSAWFAASDPPRLVVVAGGRAALYELPSGRPVRGFDLPPGNGAAAAAVSPDGRLVAVAGNPTAVFEVATGRKRFEITDEPEAATVTFSADGRRLLVAGAGGAVVFDVRAGVGRRLRAGGDPGFTAAAFSPTGATLATGADDGLVVLWDAATGEPLVAFDRHEGRVTGAAFSPDGRRLLTAADDGTCLVWDATARPAPVAAVAGADEAVALLASADPAAAQRGLAYLARTPDDAVRLLTARVPVPAAVPAERVAALVADLGHADFPTRQAAVAALADVGAEAGPALRAAIGSGDAEVRKLAGELLGRLAAPLTRPDDLRAVRAVELLEALATPPARELLGKWAAGPAHHRLTTEATAAVRRLR